MSNEMWNPFFGKMDRATLDKVQLKRLKDMVTFAYENSSAYRELYDLNGVTPECIQTIADIKRFQLSISLF